MSYLVSDRVWQDPRPFGFDRLLLLTLAHEADEMGRVRARIEIIAARSSLNVSGVRRGVVRLVRDGFVVPLTDANAVLRKRAASRLLNLQIPSANGNVLPQPDHPASTAAPVDTASRGVAQSAPMRARVLDPVALQTNPAVRRVLAGLAQRRDGLTKRNLAVAIGVSFRSGAFDEALRLARDAGWISSKGSRGEVRLITSEGIEALGEYERLPTDAALQQLWLSRLNDDAANVFKQILEAFPGARYRSVVKPGLNLIAADLRDRGLIEDMPGGGLRASDVLFD